MIPFRFIILSALLMVMSCEKPEQPGGQQGGGGTTEDDFKVPVVTPRVFQNRMLWASINNVSNATDSKFRENNGKVLVSWRLYPTDDKDISFDLYRQTGSGSKVKLNSEPIRSATCWQDTKTDTSKDNTYYLCISGEKDEVGSYTLKASESLPYISIPLKSASDLGTWIYNANDASVGDLDGDGVPEIVIRRVLRTEFVEDEGAEGDDASSSTILDVRHTNLYEAYELDGTFLWRVASGPNINLGNASSFAVCDFDGDGACEVAMRTAEGTVFGNGKEIRDMNVDGKTDYRVPGSSYPRACPNYISVIEGKTGKELARADYIPLGTSEEWGDNYFKRAHSLRVGAGNFSGGCPSIVIGRGCYGKIVIEAWDFYDGKLYKRWNFDTTADGRKYKDYEAQGYHNFRTADVDGDGFDEVIYGSCTIDHDGKGLNCCGLGHGDALHVGAFDNSGKMYIWGCYETGTVGAALRNGSSGSVVWKYDSTDDVGRAMTADIDPDSPGNEMWWYRGNVHSFDGKNLGYTAASCNFGIWWTGSLNRQLLDGTKIDCLNEDKTWSRAFTIYRYDVSAINGSKNNPCYAGDFLGDWREEMIFPTSDYQELRIFSTWYPTEYRVPYLLSDHTYNMSAVNQNIGYNQPNHLGYYLCPDSL
ncbi:MAG: hypothetical protein E7123_06265 [Bacteroidales bacterium]|nr:hypothetical protein [Bacteroidales bacterium]